MSHPLPASRQKDPTETYSNEAQGWIVPRHIPKESESSQPSQNVDFQSSELLPNGVTTLDGAKNVPFESDFWALCRSLGTSKIVILEWMTMVAQSCPSACVRRKYLMKLAEHVVKKGATPPPEVVEAAVNLEKCVEELQQYSLLNFSAEQISSCEAYFENSYGLMEAWEVIARSLIA